MRFTPIVIILLFSLPVSAQRVKYAPFQFQQQIGIMDTSGNVILDVGSLKNSYLIVNDFKEYILTDNLLTSKDFFFDANKGKGDFEGWIDNKAGALKIGNKYYYHFWDDEGSVLVSSGKDVIRLSKKYMGIEPNEQAWSNEALQSQPLLWALTTDGTYDILAADNGFQPVNNLPAFESFDLLFDTPKKEGAMKLVGFVLGSHDVIERDFGQLYDIPENAESGKMVEVYDINFRKIGRSPYNSKEISTLVKKEIKLRGSFLPPPQMRHSIIYPNGKIVVLNNEFALIPNEKDSQLVLVNTKKNNEPILWIDEFDYRYFSTSDNLKSLLQIRHRKSNSIFFFDFDGRFFPKGMPMIPKSKLIEGSLIN